MTLATPLLSPVFQENNTVLHNICDFDLQQTLDCGQAFRWYEQPDGSFTGVAFKKVCHISHLDNNIILHGVNQADFEGIWRGYFDLDRDYSQIKQQFSVNPVLAKATAYAPGIRVLKQEPWEALCSFIISQNNNVKRIKGIVDRLCTTFGEPISGGFYAFPTPETLARCSPEDLAPIRAGFRARYLIDAAQRVASGEIDLEILHLLPLDEARATLMRITGVGIKVADCALLYGCGRIDCFPIDVWIRRAMDCLFPDGLPDCAADYAGIAQQYIFHYARTCPAFSKESNAKNRVSL
ncbi:DNA-3-methyladenine glycosylase [Oscillospiraceae bacterium PP1C4]